LGAAGTRTRPDRWVDAGAETRATHRPSALESVNPWSKRDTDGLKLTARVAAPESKRGAVMAGQWGASRERRRPGKKSVKPRRAAKRGDDATLARHRSLLPDDVRDLYDAVAAHIAHRHHS